MLQHLGVTMVAILASSWKSMDYVVGHRESPGSSSCWGDYGKEGTPGPTSLALIPAPPLGQLGTRVQDTREGLDSLSTA